MTKTRRGRPRHRRTKRNIEKVSLLLALEWSSARIANALAISRPPFVKVYGSIISEQRDRASDKKEAEFYVLLWQQVENGSVAAMKLWAALQEQRDIAAGRIPAPFREKLGKKAAASAAALTAHEGTEWQSLLKH